MYWVVFWPIMSSNLQFPLLALKVLLDKNKSPQIIDIRTIDEFEDFSLGGTCVDFEALIQSPNEFIKRKNSKVLILCYTGLQSHIAVTMLRKKGYYNVFNVEHGLEAFLAL